VKTEKEAELELVKTERDSESAELAKFKAEKLDNARRVKAALQAKDTSVKEKDAEIEALKLEISRLKETSLAVATEPVVSDKALSAVENFVAGIAVGSPVVSLDHDQSSYYTDTESEKSTPLGPAGEASSASGAATGASALTKMESVPEESASALSLMEVKLEEQAKTLKVLAERDNTRFVQERKSAASERMFAAFVSKDKRAAWECVGNASGVDLLEFRDAAGMTALHFAARIHDVPLVELVLDRSPFLVNVCTSLRKNPAHWTALMCVCELGKTDEEHAMAVAAKLLPLMTESLFVESGIGSNCLHLCADRGNYYLARMILRHVYGAHGSGWARDLCSHVNYKVSPFIIWLHFFIDAGLNFCEIILRHIFVYIYIYRLIHIYIYIYIV
jgi:hypothetical protein